MKACLWVVVLTIASSGLALGAEQLVWQDEFDFLDDNKWEHFVTGWRGGNWEFQYYRNNRQNSYIKDGMLYIHPTFTADEYGEGFLYNGQLNLWNEGCNDEMNIDGGCIITADAANGGNFIVNPIQSARMRTKRRFDFTYGRVEIRASMPKGDWLWPALWMLPSDDAYGGWPRSGEIDIMESRGNDDWKCGGVNQGRQRAGSTLHWGTDGGNNHWYQTHWEREDGGNPFGGGWHLLGLEWTPNEIIFTMDTIEIGRVTPPAGGFWELGGFSGNNIWGSGSKMAPFDRNFHFVFNVAVGGNFFDDGCVNGNGAKPWYGQNVPGAMKSFWEGRGQWGPTWTGDDVAMKIDYVRVYQQV